ncbi:MAG: methylated-DNA--[protein]-cysteine S-methyltransferase [Deltaproteobacteria bacterium]|nr:methylated-DNA--[protein]-cysteine S-methyltransferase [Deltaproteobacteria bacterium]
MIYTTTFDTPYCSIILAGNEEGLCHLHLDTGEVQQINEYMTGKRQQFKVKLNPHGTVFQKRVWHELTMIGYGELESYKEVACAIGNPNGARAVGMANSKNPIPLIIPCHRVVGANGKLTGFAHGLAIKEKLIVLEQA